MNLLHCMCMHACIERAIIDGIRVRSVGSKLEAGKTKCLSDVGSWTSATYAALVEELWGVD